MTEDKIITDLDFLRNNSQSEASSDITIVLDVVSRMKKVLPTAWVPGFGLAAIQIGYPARMAWFKFNGSDNILINPKILSMLGKYAVIEGCLSIPGVWRKIERAYEIEYLNDGKKCKAKGTKAQIIQHEIDHMNGILILDHEAK